MTPALTPLSLASISCPTGMTLVLGGSRATDLPFIAPPDIPLDSSLPSDILAALEYAGIRYAAHDSPAARYGLRLFETAREFGQGTTFARVTFDWDHTLGNYKVFEDIAGVIRTKGFKNPPPEEFARRPMTAIEIARPFMQEIAWGMAVGFAVRQGILSLKDWERYRPKVGLATHTWPDRLGVLARHFVRLIPLLEGLLPGSPGVYEKITGAGVRSIVHLHDFLGYSRQIAYRFEAGGLEALSPAELDDLRAYAKDGKAHYRKPLGALALRGWEVSSWLHFDDSTAVISDLERHAPRVRAVRVRQPHPSVFANVQEWHKIALSGLWTSREKAAAAAVRDLAWMESENGTTPALMAVLSVLRVFTSWPFQSDLPDLSERTRLPEGVVLTVNETPTTLGEFWEYYVRPTNEAKRRLRTANRP